MRKLCIPMQRAIASVALMSGSFFSPIWLSSFGVVLPLVLADRVEAAELTDWSFDTTTRQLTLTLNGGGTPDYFLLAQPPRIVVDIPQADVGNVVSQQTFSGSVRSVRVGQFQPGQVRIVMELSSDVVFAPGQVEMQRVEGDRWVIRPLLAGDTPTVAAMPSVSPPPSSLPSGEAGTVEFVAPTVAPSSVPSNAPIDSPSSSGDRPSPTNLPPLEPGSIELSVTPPVEATPTPPSPSISRPATPPTLPAEDAPLRDASRVTTLRSPVPVLDAVVPNAQPLPGPDPDLRIHTPTTAPSHFAPFPGIGDAPAASMPNGSGSATIEFGQPLSGRSRPDPAANPAMAPPEEREIEGTVIAANSSSWLPAGTRLMLRYPGTRSLDLENLTSPRQEVLLLHLPVVDSAGRVMIPAESQVLGRFEATGSGGRFVVQALSVDGINVQANGQSDRLRGDRQSPAMVTPSQLIEVEITEDIIYQ